MKTLKFLFALFCIPFFLIAIWINPKWDFKYQPYWATFRCYWFGHPAKCVTKSSFWYTCSQCHNQMYKPKKKFFGYRIQEGR